MPGPRYLSTGVVDDRTFESPVQSVRSFWLSRAQAVGSVWTRIDVYWNTIAPAQLPPGFQAANPSDPSYQWSTLDGAVRSATASGQRVLLMIFFPPAWALTQGAPSWAPPASWKPSSGALGAFAHALAERYSGLFPDPLQSGSALPHVDHFQAWNEPNLSTSLSPQWTRNKRGRFVPASPYIYRRMLNAVYKNVKSVQPHAYILAAGTAPYGDPPGGPRMTPVVFTRELLCLHGAALRPEYCPHPAHFNALDHHPYAAAPTRPAFNRNDVSVPDLGRLGAILRVARRTHRAAPAGAKQIWVTEMSWDSNPPDPNGIPLARQARYLALAFYELWSQGVSHICWFELSDPGFSDSVLTGAGVYFSGGDPKPSATAFQFPFVALRGGDGALTLWGRSPKAGVVTIERGRGRGWRRLIGLATTANGVFYAHIHLGRHAIVRARSGSMASLAWPTR